MLHITLHILFDVTLPVFPKVTDTVHARLQPRTAASGQRNGWTSNFILSVQPHGRPELKRQDLDAVSKAPPRSVAMSV